MDDTLKTWIARFVSLTLYAALVTLLITVPLPRLLSGSGGSRVTIKTELPKTDVMQKLTDAGVDPAQITFRQGTQLNSFAFFFSARVIFCGRCGGGAPAILAKGLFLCSKARG